VRVVWLDGGLVAPGDAALSIDDPAVRWGEGLLETMRAEAGRVALLERHLERLTRSARELGLALIPTADAMRAAVGEALAASGAGTRRVRLCASPRPTLLVEVTDEPPMPAEVVTVSAISLTGAWIPGNRIAEHKTLSYAGHRWSQRRATAAGADHALLLDDRGRLGEAAIASVFCAVGGELLTAPADGLLAGVARGVVMAALPVREEAPAEELWRDADEIVLTNAVRGAIAVTVVDGEPVGDGAPGPVARRIHAALTGATSGA
jgi:branched-chain amino acid aminotransferase